MQLPDFSVGYGTEVEDGGDWSAWAVLVIVAPVIAVVVYFVRRKRKGKK